MNKPTREQISENFELWGEYVDPDATMSEDEFETLTDEEKLKIQEECFGEEGGEE